MTVRDDLHRLVDTLTESELPAVRRYVASLRGDMDDPLTRFLNAAPIDDEPTTPEEDRDAAAAREEVRRGETVSAEEIERTLLV